MKITLLTVLIFLQFILSSQEVLDTTIHLKKKHNTLVIINIDSAQVNFNLKINNFFPFTINSIVDSIKQLSSNSKDYYEAWRFVSKNTDHTRPYSSQNWQHEPALFLNSVGTGFCDDRASVLVRIWKELGYDARVIGISGHVISEVFVEGKWKMFDPDLFTYYSRNDTILSVNEIENNPEIVREGVPRGRGYADFYESTEDNADNTRWHLDYKDWDTNMILPKYSSIELIDFKKRNTLRVNVPTGINGVIKLPFVPVFVKGKGMVSVNNEIIEVHGITMIPKDIPVEEISVVENVESLEIYYLVNDKIEIIETPISMNIENSKGVLIESQKTKLSRKILKRLSYDRINKNR